MYDGNSLWELLKMSQTLESRCTLPTVCNCKGTQRDKKPDSNPDMLLHRTTGLDFQSSEPIHMSYTCTSLHGAPVRIKSILMQLSERQIFKPQPRFYEM